MTTKAKPRRRCAQTLTTRLRATEESVRQLRARLASLDEAVARHLREARP